MSDIRKCPGCNADVGENDKFCPYCGESLIGDDPNMKEGGNDA